MRLIFRLNFVKTAFTLSNAGAVLNVLSKSNGDIIQKFCGEKLKNLNVFFFINHLSSKYPTKFHRNHARKHCEKIQGSCIVYMGSNYRFDRS